MPADDRTPQQLLDEARETAITLSLSQIGDVNAMANHVAVEFFERSDDDINLVYAVVRVMTASITVLAAALASKIEPDANANRQQVQTAQIIRQSVNEVNFTIRQRDEE